MRTGKEIYLNVLDYIGVIIDSSQIPTESLDSLMEAIGSLNRPAMYSDAYISRTWSILTDTVDNMDMLILKLTSDTLRCCVDGEAEYVALCNQILFSEAIHSKAAETLGESTISRLPSYEKDTNTIHNNPWSILTIAIEDYVMQLSNK